MSKSPKKVESAKPIRKSKYDIIPAPGKVEEHQHFKGDDLFGHRYFRMMILAPSTGGKTTLIYNLLDFLLPKPKEIKKNGGLLPFVFICSPNIDTDDTYTAIKSLIAERDVPLQTYASTKIDGISVPSSFTKVCLDKEKEKARITTANEMRLEARRKLKIEQLTMQGMSEDAKAISHAQTRKFKKPKSALEQLAEEELEELPPEFEYFFVIDDLTNELNDKQLSEFMYTCRHHKVKLFVCNHYCKKLAKSMRNQLSHLALFSGVGQTILMDLLEDLGFDVSKDKETGTNRLCLIYQSITGGDTLEERIANKHNFMFVQRTPMKIMFNFEEEIPINF